MKKHSLVLLVFALGLVSCSGEPEESNLTLTISNKTAYLIPSTSVSCAAILQAKISQTAPASDISSKYFSMTSPKLVWADAASTATISLIKIRIRSSAIQGGEYTCTLGSEELSAQFSDDSNVGWNMTLEQGEANAKKSAKICPTMKCGGVTLTNEIPFTATAQVDVYGVATSHSNQEETPIRSSTTFNVENVY